MDRAPLAAGETEELTQWLTADRRRRGAFIRARAIWMRSESARALGPQYDPENFQPAAAEPPPPAHVERRRPMMKWSGALAASLVVAVMLVTTLQMPTAYATAKGEMRTVPLGDGATVTLNTDTHIKLYDDEGRRRIRVLRGEVLIEGAAATSPTLVEVDGKQLEGSAATFVVRKLNDQPAQVLVQEGRVVLAEERQATLPLSANTGASLLEGKEQGWQLRALSYGQLSRELAWREGKIALQGETLAEAVALYARYSDTPIVIADPGLATVPVAGLFAVNNALGFSRAVANVFDADVRQEGDRIVIAARHRAGGL
ncbi:FecR family protein [Peristeroidobacter agariperforans]|uniref:FecR family protein n=1 Tax=Peristeroidobacter agariperforans TaxID=268404 RepID=UPI00101D72BF|nr:FecR domain-containing protein [Peristeroidobacter agariperforans]